MPVLQGPTAPATAATTLRANRVRFSIEPPYLSVRLLQVLCVNCKPTRISEQPREKRGKRQAGLAERLT